MWVFFVVDVTKGVEACEWGITPNNIIGCGLFEVFLFSGRWLPKYFTIHFGPCVHV